MDNTTIIIAAIAIAFFLSGIASSIIEEIKYQAKRKKVVEGAIFAYYNGNNMVQVEVIEDNYLYFTVRYRIVGEECIREMLMKDFVKVYLS